MIDQNCFLQNYTGLAPGTNYTYTFTSVDSAGNEVIATIVQGTTADAQQTSWMFLSSSKII